MRCPRCGNEDPSWFYLGSKGWYCRRCVGFSRRLACEAEEPAVPELSEPLDPQLRLDYPLTPNQKQISDQLCELSETHDVLVDAVCGAGKTEIVMDCLRRRLRRGQRGSRQKNLTVQNTRGQPGCPRVFFPAGSFSPGNGLVICQPAFPLKNNRSTF